MVLNNNLISDEKKRYARFRMGTPPVPFKNAYWVVPDKFMAGGFPGSTHPERARPKLAGLLDAGIRHVIDLMEIHETEEGLQCPIPYAETLKEIAAERGIEISISRHPIRDGDIPTPKRLKEILEEIDRTMAAGRPFYLHCLGGIGRTGTVVGCYLIRNGLATGDTVFDEIARIRRKTPAAGVRSPEAESQRMVIRSWRPLGELN